MPQPCTNDLYGRVISHYDCTQSRFLFFTVSTIDYDSENLVLEMYGSGGGEDYTGVKRIGMTVGNPKKLH